MPEHKRRAWTRDELLKALSLYCQIPFGKMHSKNPAVIALASAIGRTPAAVALKLVNFASLDPELHGRGVRGMANASQADRSIWQEFFGKWDQLADHVICEEEASRAAPRRQPVDWSPPDGPTEMVRTARVRRGQSFFRAAVMAAYDNRCCITGITSPELLRASHIVPWSGNPSLRLDPRNGLCLNALHDAAFDRGLIAFTDELELCISSRLKQEVPAAVYAEMFESRVGTQIRMPERFRPTTELLQLHRSELFRG